MLWPKMAYCGIYSAISKAEVIKLENMFNYENGGKVMENFQVFLKKLGEIMQIPHL